MRDARFRLIMMRVPMRQPKVTVLITAKVEQYASKPAKRMGTLAPERTPAIEVEVTTRRAMGAHSIQCLVPNDIDRPMRT